MNYLNYYQGLGVVSGVVDLSTAPQTITIDETAYPISFKQKARKKLQPGQTQNFRVYPFRKKGKLTFKAISVVSIDPAPFVLKGCWETHDDEPRFIVYRNQLRGPEDTLLSVIVPISWEDAPPADGQFWRIEAKLQENQLIVIRNIGPFSPPRKVTAYQPFSKTLKPDLAQQTALLPETAVKSQAQPTAAATPAKSLTPQEILAMATPAKISLTCKLNQIPAHRELPDKQIEFFLNDGSDRIFTVRMKPKMFKKFTDHAFARWVAAISGDLGQNTETGFELLNAAVQIFQKKAPADAQAAQEKAPTEKTAASAVARPEPPKAEAPVGAGKRKSLLDGVSLK